MRKFVGKTETKKMKFMGDTVEVRKLSAGAVKRIGEASQPTEDGPEVSTLDTLVVILNEAVVLPEGEEPIDAELLEEFPLDDLNKLVTEVMSYAGVGVPEGNADV